MSDAIDWLGLVNDANTVKEYPKSGDIPSDLPTDKAQLGTGKPSHDGGYSDISPESPKSPTKKQGTGHNDNLDARAGIFDDKFFCDINRGVGALVNLQAAPDKGLDCQGCNHLKMMHFVRAKDRRLFHWRCTQGYNILEAGCAGERVLVAPPECQNYQDASSVQPTPSSSLIFEE